MSGKFPWDLDRTPTLDALVGKLVEIRFYDGTYPPKYTSVVTLCPTCKLAEPPPGRLFEAYRTNLGCSLGDGADLYFDELGTFALLRHETSRMFCLLLGLSPEHGLLLLHPRVVATAYEVT